MACPICEQPSRDDAVHDECWAATIRKFYDIVAGNFRQEEIEVVQTEIDGVYLDEWLDYQRRKYGATTQRCASIR